MKPHPPNASFMEFYISEIVYTKFYIHETSLLSLSS
jgi:hypothetical protein